MILLSVGTQFPFDRLVRAVDGWAGETRRQDVVAQIGPSDYKPKALKCMDFLGPDEFRKLQAEADIIIAHAGMGSILTALEMGKPIIIMPRDHLRGEHRNGHQLATAERFCETPGVYVAKNEEELAERLNRLDDLAAAQLSSKKAPDDFVRRLRTFVEDDRPPPGFGIRLFNVIFRS
ncbi:glycosyltransferase [Terrarubrum flagellatum]|uniref:glycosyltransferase n=1 Tax=Terrirubrum flagellatum TaxID=2895980 RepID=UPI003144EBAC